jgi:two-component system phosphate regulon sensor histidine kinase PhoR
VSVSTSTDGQADGDAHAGLVRFALRRPRWRLFFATLLLLTSAVALADWSLSVRLTQAVVRRAEADLSVRCALVADRLTAPTPAVSTTLANDELQAFVRSLGASAAARVTVVDERGRVLADSEVPPAEIDKLPSHRDREEIASALARGQGTAIRTSPTLHTPLLYVAQRLPSRTEPTHAAVVRLAVPLAELDRVAAESRRLLVVALVAAALLALLLSTLAAQLTASPLEGTIGRLDRSLASSLAEVAAQRDRVNGILESMAEGVLVLDREGAVVLVNAALRAMLVPSASPDAPGAEAAILATLAPVIDEVRADDLTQPAAPVNVSVRELELDIAGSRRRLAVRATPRTEPPGLLLVVVDVTDLRRLEAMRRDFVTNASHELRTPISSIVSAAETLANGALKDAVAGPKFTDIILRNADRLRRIVDDLLELSRLESRALQLHPEPGSVSEIAEHVVGLFRARAESRGIVIDTAIPHDLPLARFDRRALEGVFSNLVDNAVKYCPSGTRIRLEASHEEDDDVIGVCVADDGPGIADVHLPRLFERFYRVDRGRARDVGGTGLGLSIVKHQIEAMGGEIAVDSKVGRGTRFSFSVPVA